MIKEVYCSFEVSKLLKEKGFPQKSYDTDCNTCYKYSNGGFCNNAKSMNGVARFVCVMAPTHQMAMAWLRENDVAIEIYIDIDWGKESHRSFRANIIKIKDFLSVQEIRGFSTHEEAVEAALLYVLKNLI